MQQQLKVASRLAAAACSEQLRERLGLVVDEWQHLFASDFRRYCGGHY
jgi:hypothetical protein